MLINPPLHKKAHDESPPFTDRANPPVVVIDLTITMVAIVVIVTILVVAVIDIILVNWLRRHPATRGAGCDDS